jgi:hypothetical protein
VNNIPTFEKFIYEKSYKELGSNEQDMVVGIADILNQVKDTDNRKSIADDQIDQFKKENIVFDYSEFMDIVMNKNK